MRQAAKLIFLCATLAAALLARAADDEYLLGAGDIIHITVFQNPDLTTDARVSESGEISLPLVGVVKVGGATVPAAEKLIETRLAKGGFIRQPQVNIFPTQIRGSQVSVLGQVNRPGRYPLDPLNMRVADMIALAGGVAPTGADSVVVTGMRDGGPMREEITLDDLFARDGRANHRVSAGDIIYVARAPQFYIYGEVQRPGAYRLEDGMTLMQALATGGGLTLRGTERGMEVHRRGGDGQLHVITVGRNDVLQPDDVVYVKESLF